MRRKMLAALVIAVCLPIAALAVLSGISRRPPGLGVKDGRLAPCPDSPNCVNTQSDRAQSAIEPYTFAGSADQAMQRLRSIVEAQSGATIVTVDGNYLHAEFTSRIFRFVDDVEFFIDENAHQIQFRAASRVGHSDLGANRRRMESIRREFQSQPPAPAG